MRSLLLLAWSGRVRKLRRMGKALFVGCALMFTAACGSQTVTGQHELQVDETIPLRSAPVRVDAGREDMRCTFIQLDGLDIGLDSLLPVFSPRVVEIQLFKTSGMAAPEQQCWTVGSAWQLVAVASLGANPVPRPVAHALPATDGDVYVLRVHILNVSLHPVVVEPAGFDLRPP
jgi:hypothetical protein